MSTAGTTGAPSRLDRRSRREQLVEAAVRVFRNRDASEVTFEEVAEAAGVSRALVYNYFGDRRGLVAAVHLHLLADLRREVDDAVLSATSHRDAVARVVRAHLDFARTHPEGYRQVIGESALRNHPEQWAERLHGVALGWDGAPETRLLAGAVLALLHASVIGWMESQDVPVERAVELIARLLWAGVEGVTELGVPHPLALLDQADDDGQPGVVVSTARQQYQAAALRNGR